MAQRRPVVIRLGFLPQPDGADLARVVLAGNGPCFRVAEPVVAARLDVDVPQRDGRADRGRVLTRGPAAADRGRSVAMAIGSAAFPAALATGPWSGLDRP